MSRIRQFAAALILFVGVPLPVASADSAPGRYDNHKLVEVRLDTSLELMRMLAVSGDHWSCSPMLGRVPFRVPPDRMDALKASGLEFRILHENVQELIDAERDSIANARGGWFATYHNYNDVSAYVDTLVALRPDLAARFNTGNSLQGRSIFGIRVTGAGGVAGKPALLFNGCQHAREWVAVKVPMYIADQLVRNYDTDPFVRAILDRVVVYVVPIVNPDGYEYTWTNERLWRKNRRNNGDGTFGVDTNRNWSVGWGLDSGSSGSPSSETYRGTAAFSEPEPQRIRDFVLAHPEIEAHIDFHSYSQLILSPYGYFNGEPAEPDRSRFNTLNLRMHDAIQGVHGEDYIYGPIGNTLYLASGSAVDWAYDAGGTLSWTIELRPDTPDPGFVLPADQILPTCEENFAAVSVLFDYVAYPISFSFPNGLPATANEGSTTSIQIAINSNLGSLAAGTAQQFVRVGTSGSFTPAPLTPAGGNLFTATLPAANCGQTIEYYFQAQSTGGQTVRSPADAPASLHSASVTQTTVAFADDMEIDRGWTIGAAGDNATLGLWVRVNPNGTTAQPEDDHTAGAGVTCWVTGQGSVGGSVGQADVDGGRTTLLTPWLNQAGSPLSLPLIQFWCWYSNDEGSAPSQDVFRVDLTTDGTNWANALTIGPAGAAASGGWFFYEIRAADFVTLPAEIRVRFVAEDAGAGSIVEAAIDDFVVLEQGCDEPPPCPGDVNGDGVRDLTDLSELLASFGLSTGEPGFNPGADFDGNGDVDLGDLSVMLAGFGTLCP